MQRNPLPWFSVIACCWVIWMPSEMKALEAVYLCRSLKQNGWLPYVRSTQSIWPRDWNKLRSSCQSLGRSMRCHLRSLGNSVKSVFL